MKNKSIKISIIGLGLIGGSLALALKDKGFDNVNGFSKSKIDVKDALKSGAIKACGNSLEDTIKGSKIIFICTPIAVIKEVILEILKVAEKGAIVTDVGSVKSELMNWVENELGQKDINFVGGHPMAGKEKSGFSNADGNLFDNCTWCLCTIKSVKKSKFQELVKLIKIIGAKPTIIKPEDHDKAVTSISHIPFLLSSILVNMTRQSEQWPLAKRLAAEGFRDTTRLAGGNMELHLDICIANKEKINRQLNQLEKITKTTRKLIQNGNTAGLKNFLINNKQARVDWFSKSRFKV